MSMIYEGPTLVPEPDYVFDLNTPWAQRDFAEPERKKDRGDVRARHHIGVTYTHSAREAPIIVDTLRSKSEDEDGKDDKAFMIGQPHAKVKFAGKELMWSNKLRLKVIEEDIHMYVPQVLYLVRPETAYTACLHYLARQLGGAEGYLAERSFIFQNPGLTRIMTRFWEKVQEVAWSGGFAPSISEDERALLMLALIEVFSLTRVPGGQDDKVKTRPKEGLYLVPHVRAPWLENVGMYFPSIIDPVEGDEPVWNDEPIEDSVDVIRESFKRANLPGIPSDIGAFLTCHSCEVVFDTPTEKREHECPVSEPLSCNACGLDFELRKDYQLHAVTFCRQGPLAGGVCPTCQTKGPKCLCQGHWMRTYALASSMWEGRHGRGEWLTQGISVARDFRKDKDLLEEDRKNPLVASMVIMAHVFEEVPIIEGGQPASDGTGPEALSPTLWDPKNVKIPIKDPDQDEVCMVQSGKEPIPLKKMREELLKQFQLRWVVKSGEDPETPMKEKDRGTLVRRAQRAKFLDSGALRADEFTTKEDYKKIKEKIKLTESKIQSGEENRKMFAESLGLSEKEVMSRLKKLKSLAMQMAAILVDKIPPPKPSPKPSRRTSPRTSAPTSHHGSLDGSGNEEDSDSGSDHSVVGETLKDKMDRLSRGMRRKIEFRTPEDGKRKKRGERSRSGSKSKSPGERTDTSMRGSSKTHTLCMELTRAMGFLRRVTPDHKSSNFKRHHARVMKGMEMAEKHLREDEEAEIDVAYEEHLLSCIDEAEVLLSKVDEEGDKVEQGRQKRKEENDLISKTLPRTHAIKWNGTRQDYMRFKQEALTLMRKIPNDRIALNAILDIISDQTLKRTLARYKTPKLALDSLELQFGNPELSGPALVKDLQNLTRATTAENEASLILKIREIFEQLAEIDRQQLLGVDVLFNLCHKFREQQGVALLKKLKAENDPTRTRELFRTEIDDLYTTNTIWSRTSLEKRTREPVVPPRENRRDRQHPGRYADNRRTTTGSEGSRATCKICKEGHNTFACKKIKEMNLQAVRPYSLCHKCLNDKHDGECPFSDRPFVCRVCKINKRLKVHNNCNKEKTTSFPAPTLPVPKKVLPTQSTQPRQSTQSQSAPKVESTSNRRFQTRREFARRSDCGPLLNPNPINSGLDMIDHVWIFAPDGRKRKVRVIHDQFGANDTLADINLSSYSHCSNTLLINMNTTTGEERMETDEMILKIRLADGTFRFIKTVATDMRSKKAYTLQTKCIDLPRHWNSLHCRDTLMHSETGDLRCHNLTEGHEIELLIGSDLGCLAPVEVDRYNDNAGCVTLYNSKLQNDEMLLGGSRLVGLSMVPPPDTHHRFFKMDVCSGNAQAQEEVIIRRCVTKDTSSILFPENPLAKMSKVDKQFFKEFQDNNLLPPHPRACKGCTACLEQGPCADISAVHRRKTMEENLDKLCTLDEGGWKIRLLWNSLKEKVPTNEQDALRRFLATERSLIRSPSALTTFNAQVLKCLEKGYFVLAKDYKEDLKDRQVSYLPLSYALKDNPEDSASSQEGNDTNIDSKTKARPVSDGSHKGGVDSPSVNEALVPIPDLWTGKIQHLLLKYRTAQRLALGDISQYYHRLRLDLDSVSMTRAIWREGGIGGQGELTTMIVPSASMGLAPVPALASHCRARTADRVKDDIAKASLKESYVDDVYQMTLWTGQHPTPGTRTSQPLNSSGHISKPEPDEVLIQRIDEVEEALKSVKLELGGSGWITDMDHDTLPEGRLGVNGVTEEKSHRDVGVSTTGALGLRWNLSKALPDGGTFSYRVHRPGSLNLLPKKRGKRPSEGELYNREDIQHFLSTRGMNKAGLLRLVMNLFDCLQLALPWTSTAKLLYREVLTENPGLGWKEPVPKKYYPKIENLAADLLLLSTTQMFPRRAVHMGLDGTIGYLTLILAHDASAESACVLAYIHQQWPYNSVMMPSSVTGRDIDVDEAQITTKVSLLCGSHKLAEHGHEEQVASELLSATIAVRLKKVIVENSLVKFDKIIYLGDSFTVTRVIRKNNRAYNTWAGTRVSFIQRNEDLDNMYHVPGSFLLKTADRGTRAYAKPSSLMDCDYWEGTGSLDVPIHMLPITSPSQYTTPGLDGLGAPASWLHKSAVQLQPVGTSVTVTCHRVEIEMEDDLLITATPGLDRLKVKHRSFEKLKRIMMHILKMSPAHRQLEAHQLLEQAAHKWYSLDYDIIKKSLVSTTIPKDFQVKVDEVKKVFKVQGRSGYSVPLLANPKKSRLTRVILKQYHDQNHCSSPATVQSILFKDFFVIGGAVPYIKKLGGNCPRCDLLRARPSQALAGKAPLGTQGPLETDKSIWRRWMADICGPIMVTPWSGKKNTRANGPSKSLKHWILLTVDLCSRQLDAVLIEGYSAASVLTGMRELMARHGPPQHIYWDRASNLHAAAALFKDDTDATDNEVDIKRLIKVQEELQRSFRANGITVHLSIPFSSHRQGRIEANVKRLKNKLVQLCYDESQTKLTPMEVTSTLATACDILNQRPLLLTAESTVEEKNILCPAYLTCADLDLKHTSCLGDPDRIFSIHNSPLTRRATMIQERIEVFRETFDIFMTRNLASLGKFNRMSPQIEVGDVCLILDKVRQGTLPVQAKKRYTLGVVERMLSDRSCVLRYVRQDKVFTCERSIQGLALITKASRLEKIMEEDIIIDPIFPVDVIAEEKQEEDINQVELDQDIPEEVETAVEDGNLEEQDIEPDQITLGTEVARKKPVMKIEFVKDADTEAIRDVRKRKKAPKQTK